MTKKHQKVQVVVTAGNEFLLFKTNARRGNFWQNITGSVERGEEFFEAAKREFTEESGADINLGEWSDLALDFSFVDQWEREVKEKCFHVHFPQKFKVKIDPSEHDEAIWVSIEQLHPKIVKYESNYQAILQATKGLK